MPEQTPRNDANPNVYEPPKIEMTVTKKELEREVHYAGRITTG
jgi:hypothetical protein